MLYAIRTAATGQSNGIPLTQSAADAPLSAITSYWFSPSIPRIVPTTCVSCRYSAGKLGRSGRSIRRQARMASSEARPSRRKKDPGIRPAAYIRSSISTVSGKKSAPSRGLLDAVAVTKTCVEPILAVTAPLESPANLPVSNERVLSVPEIGPDTEMASAIVFFYSFGEAFSP